MRKKVLLFISLFLLCLPSLVLADELEIAGSGVYIRKSPKGSGEYFDQVNSGVKYPLVSTTKVADQGGCGEGWYNVLYNGQNAYVCSKFARIISTPPIQIDKSTCESELRTKGFPEPYVVKLCELKQKYPYWDFNPVLTGLDFRNAVENESICGWNTIKTDNAAYKDTSCTGKFDSGYSSASQTAVANYMNPFNFLNEKGIFMFESSYVNSGISDEAYTNVIPKIISAFMIKNLPTIKDAINYGARNKGVSQSIMSARILQELGEGKATSGAYAGGLLSCISGDYTNRWGLVDGVDYNYYYNFFNIGVFDGSNSNAALKAVKAAKARGFGGTGDQAEDLRRAMLGGATFLRDEYLDVGQKAIYYQKFNVYPSKASNLYGHQYMSNVAAAYSESKILYNAYSSANLMQSPFVFFIPVYNNMDESIVNSANGGTGDFSENSANGLGVETIIVSSGYKLIGNVISGVEAGTSLEDFKNKINSMGGTITGDLTGNVATGKKITISNQNASREYTFIVKGDTSGDGEINAIDLLQIQKNILGSYKMSDVYLSAADPSGDGKVNAIDLLQVQKNILGTYKIEQ